MNARALGLTCVVLLATASPAASQQRSAREIIDADSILVFTDGSSFHVFERDGTFRSAPLGLSGRVIAGKWTEDSLGRFVIVGRWTWQNGLSRIDDVRRMTVIANPVDATADTLRIPGIDPWSAVKVYRASFTIEELQPACSQPPGDSRPRASRLQQPPQLHATVPGKVTRVSWTDATIQLHFAGSVRPGEPQPLWPRTRTWLLREDGSAVTPTREPYVVGVGSGGFVDYRAVHSYPDSAWVDAIALIVLVDDVLITECLPR